MHTDIKINDISNLSVLDKLTFSDNLRPAKLNFGQSGNTNSYGTNILFQKIDASRSFTLKSICTYIQTVAASNNIRLGLYDCINDLPVNLLFDSGNISTGTAGLKEAITPSIYIDKNKKYFVCVHTSSNSVFLRFGVNVANDILYSDYKYYSAFVKTQTFGALPAVISSGLTPTTADLGNNAHIFLKPL